MGKKHNRRKNFAAIPFDATITLSTLANETVITGGILTAGVTQKLFCLSSDVWTSISWNTTGEGPLLVGFAHDDLSVAEIAEALNAELNDPSNIIQRERGRRPVRKTGIIPGVLANEVLNNGDKIRTPLKFTIHDGHNLNFWAMNKSGATLTTGSILRFQGTLFGRWS